MADSGPVRISWPTKPLARIILVLVVFSLLVYHLLSVSGQRASWSTQGATNSTLGFGVILVITEDVSTWRIQGLRKVAHELDLDLTITPQRRASDDEVRNYLAGDTVTDHFDAIRLTMNYMSTFEQCILTNAETCLFMEDDADFSIAIKSQMERLSNAVAHNFGNASDNVFHIRRYPYGRDSWDVLWLGHYGIELTLQSRILAYDDPTALPWHRLESNFNDFYKDQVELNRTRQLIIHNVAPLSTYGFALTRQHAIKLLAKFKQERTQTIDVALHVDCKKLAQRCIAPVPELFHHHKVDGQSRIGQQGIKDDQIHDLAWWQTRHKYTYNVNASARCNVAAVGEKIGALWQCQPSRYDNVI